MTLADSVDPESEASPTSFETYELPHRVTSLEKLAQYMNGPTEDPILYPGSSGDTSLVSVFGNRVIHVDPDEGYMRSLRSRGCFAVTSTIEGFLKGLGPTDRFWLVYSHNAGTVPEGLLPITRYVIANNWHGSANHMGQQQEFQVVCAMVPGSSEVMDADNARKGLGLARCAVSREGRVFFGDAISGLEPGTFTVHEEPKNPEALWLFVNKTLGSSTPEGCL